MNRWNDALLAADLSPTEMRIALYVGTAADYGTGRNFRRGKPRIAADVGCSDRVVQRTLQRLQGSEPGVGMLVHVGTHGERRDRQVNVYDCKPEGTLAPRERGDAHTSPRRADDNAPGETPKSLPVKPAQTVNGETQAVSPRGDVYTSPNLVPGPAPTSKTNLDDSFTLSLDAKRSPETSLRSNAARPPAGLRKPALDLDALSPTSVSER
jgi:hypothetical protein